MARRRSSGDRRRSGGSGCGLLRERLLLRGGPRVAVLCDILGGARRARRATEPVPDRDANALQRGVDEQRWRTALQRAVARHALRQPRAARRQRAVVRADGARANAAAATRRLAQRQRAALVAAPVGVAQRERRHWQARTA